MEKIKKSTISYHVNISLHYFGESKEGNKNTHIERVFDNDDPLQARKAAFEFLATVLTTIYSLDANGFISLTSPSAAEAKGFKDCLAHSYEIFFMESEEDVQESITDDDDPEYLAESLGMEYHSYKRLGHNVGKTMTYHGETVLDTPKEYIGK